MTSLPGRSPLDTKAERLIESLAEMGPLAVAMSGGVDSSFLLAAALRARSDTIAMLAVSPSLAEASRERAHRVASRLGVELREVETKEMENPSYVANGPDRCYHCKKELFGVFQSLLEEVSPKDDRPGSEETPAEGDRNRPSTAVLLDGTQADDRGDWRPGRRAARELGVRSPLLEQDWSKQEIRDMSRAWGLETWSLAGSPCLSSRVPTGTPVELEALRRIEAAESAVARLGFPEVRVRDHGTVARIELPASDLIRALEHREEITDLVLGSGYTEVALDLRGYRPSGTPHRQSEGNDGTPSAIRNDRTED